MSDDTRVESVLAIIAESHPEVSTNIRCHLRVKRFFKLPESAWPSFSQPELAAVGKLTDVEVRVANRMHDIDADKWVKECMTAYNTPPGQSIFSKLFGSHIPTPEFYKARLQGIAADLAGIAHSIPPSIDQLNLYQEALLINQIILMALSSWAVDGNLKGLLQNRAQTLLSAIQSTQLLRANLENIQTQAQNQAQSVDQLLNVTIPNWQMAVANR